jgi:hypothetical protein
MTHPVGGQKSYWAIAPRRVRGVPGVGPGVSPGLQIISGVVWTPDFLKARDFGLLALESSGLQLLLDLDSKWTGVEST